jgi:hypothetical protein
MDGKPLFTEKGYWNGEPSATFTACIVKLNGDAAHPLWWHNAFAGTERQAIEITYGGETWCIENQNGTGFYKVTTGMGSPGCGHFSLSGHEVVRYIPKGEMITVIDKDLIAREEAIVNEYQKGKDPIEYERLQSIRAAADKFSKMTPAEQVTHIRENMMKPANPSKRFEPKGKKDGKGKR